MGSDFFFVGIVIVVIGASLFLPARSARKRDQMHQSWPTAKGTITSAEVVQPQAVAAAPSKSASQFDASVKYEFRAGGQLHFGATVSYPRYLYRKEEAERIVSRYPTGAAVTVYYNPEDIRECYLEIQNTAKYYRTGIVVMAAGVLAILFGILRVI
jgi:hypothetical protein